MVKIRTRRGYTLLEAMLAVAVIGIVAAMGSDLFVRMFQFYNQSVARTDIQRELRVILDNVDRTLRQASAASVRLSQDAGQPPCSKLTFTTADGRTVTYSQNDRTLMQTVGTNSTVLTRNLYYIAFTYPQTDVNNVVSISITLQKGTFGSRTTALQMALTKVRLINP